MTPKPKPPKIPRSLCGSWLHWLLQIPSPSRMTAAAWPVNQKREHKKYFEDRVEYEINVILWKIENRTCTRAEWRELRLWKYRKKEQEEKKACGTWLI